MKTQTEAKKSSKKKASSARNSSRSGPKDSKISAKEDVPKVAAKDASTIDRSMESSAAIAEASVVAAWNFEDAEELRGSLPTGVASKLVVFSRDWTVETIVRQIDVGNIDLDPDFQRRNAWQDDRRSRLIESFMLNFPVPQIVLAEHPEKKKSFIVIDGKQRLMTIASFYLKSHRDYWNKPIIKGLKLLPKLNEKTLDEIQESTEFRDELRQLANADIRTTVIADYEDEGTLYDIFYRLNTGSVPLSSQELRQVIHRGDFSRSLLAATDSENPLWRVLGLAGPDSRLRDVELLLRMVALVLFANQYKGNLKPFLDNAMSTLNLHWKMRQQEANQAIDTIFAATAALADIFGVNAGRKFKNGRYEPQFNRALFEVQAYYLCTANVRIAALRHRRRVVTEFERLCGTNADFLSSIESTTKSVENYRTRFREYRAMLSSTLRISIPPFPM